MFSYEKYLYFTFELSSQRNKNKYIALKFIQEQSIKTNNDLIFKL